MRRSVLLVMAAVGVCLAFGLSTLSAQRSAGAPRPAPTRAGVPAAADPSVGPGGGGIGSIRGTVPPVRFLGVTTRTFPVGVGALAASRVCNEEYPVSRLCEWADIFRAIPPVDLSSEVLVAPNYETNPVTSCLNPNGAPRCAQYPVMKPAACCGYAVPQPGPIAFLTLIPSDSQTITDCSDQFEFTVLAEDVQNQPVEGAPIFFIVPPVVGGTLVLFSPASGITGPDGTVSTTVTLESVACHERCEDPSRNCGVGIQARDENGFVYSNEVTLIDGI